MKKKLLTTTLVLAGVAVITIPVMAAQPMWEDARRSRNLANPIVLEAHADALGMTAEELKAELESGKRMREILEENGVKPGVLRDTIHEQLSDIKPHSMGRGVRGVGMYPDLLAAKADLLGMTVEDLNAALESGQKMHDLLAERDMDPAGMHEALREKYPDLKLGQMMGQHKGRGQARR